MDFRATNHVTRQHASLESYDPSHSQTITTADGGTHTVGAIGSTSVTSNAGEIINISPVLYVPALKHNLMCVGTLADQ